RESKSRGRTASNHSSRTRTARCRRTRSGPPVTGRRTRLPGARASRTAGAVPASGSRSRIALGGDRLWPISPGSGDDAADRLGGVWLWDRDLCALPDRRLLVPPLPHLPAEHRQALPRPDLDAGPLRAVEWRRGGFAQERHLLYGRGCSLPARLGVPLRVAADVVREHFGLRGGGGEYHRRGEVLRRGRSIEAPAHAAAFDALRLRVDVRALNGVAPRLHPPDEGLYLAPWFTLSTARDATSLRPLTRTRRYRPLPEGDAVVRPLGLREPALHVLRPLRHYPPRPGDEQARAPRARRHRLFTFPALHLFCAGYVGPGRALLRLPPAARRALHRGAHDDYDLCAGDVRLPTLLPQGFCTTFHVAVPRAQTPRYGLRQDVPRDVQDHSNARGNGPDPESRQAGRSLNPRRTRGRRAARGPVTSPAVR
ncbi:hypothetical protein M885DRAFT_611303, partial [Pelagophyceae sp. CCMP2097]